MSSYWEVPEIQTGIEVVQTTFIWMRYIHCALVPILIFVINKEIRRKAIDFVFFLRKNSVQSASPRPLSAMLHRQTLELNRQKQMKKFKLTDYRVPVLFSTNEGMYLRLLDKEVPVHTDSLQNSTADVSRNQWTMEPEFFTELCDLRLPGPPPGSNTTRPTPLSSRTNESEDEGFHDSSRPNSNEKPFSERKNTRHVQFKTTVAEILPHIRPLKEIPQPQPSPQPHRRIDVPPEKNLSQLKPTPDEKPRRRSVYSYGGDERRHTERRSEEGNGEEKKRKKRKKRKKNERRASDNAALLEHEHDLELQTFQSLESRFGIIR
ncbi:uncharacterized protein LOC111703159 [Eurytemora carolleeae]|uniref:uncharacterized protein LOC111703159 n=1 Tax=Eurytemora carolleeae TaxID=1294199 RepID=UPI000C7725E6|nr:uncharacterized protein LOC111703159 [Eurytemora carolleeae]|eukprot:XP_023330802.1 uncharacterized protein LOC111703159 [Eurytemora affinis]